MRNTIPLPPELETMGEDAHQAWVALRRTFEHQITIGRFVVAARQHAKSLGGRNAFYRILEQCGISEPKKFKGTLSKLETIMQHEKAVTDWHRQLTIKQQIEWSSPQSIYRHCPVIKQAVAEANKDKPRRQRTKTKKKQVDIGLAVERAFDVISDRLHGLDDVDHRASLVERLRKLADQFAPTPAPQPPTKRTTKPTKTSAATAAAAKADGLDWTAKDSGINQEFKAVVDLGDYRIKPLLDWSAKNLVGYMIEFVPTGGDYSKDRQRLAQVKTAAKAKAIAAADYAKRSKQT